jgi:hypothetical protein
MCSDSGCSCKVKVIELEDGYQVQITGDNVKDALKPENLKKCVEACCSDKGICCR